MRASTFLAPLFFASASLAQAVPEGIAPASSAPSGCEETIDSKFAIGTLDVASSKSKRETAQEASDGDLLCTLEDGILHDHNNRTGSIVANRQFQFDGPPQAGAIYTGGFSVCKNGSLAIGGTTRWWRCASGSFVNLYDEYIGAQCLEIRIQAIFASTSSSSSSSAASATTKASASASAASSASRSGSASLISGSTSVVTAFSTASAFTQSASATASRSGSSALASSTSAAAAPSAAGAASSLDIATGAALGAVMIFAGAAMLL